MEPDTLATASEPRSPWAPGLRGLTLGLLSVVLLVAFEAMAISTAMPVAAQDLGAVAEYGLVFSSFLTTSLFGMVWSGQVCDRSGPLWPVAGGVTVFGAGLLVAGFAPDMGVLVAGRAVQGLGAGLTMVGLYVLVARAYPEELRPRVFTAFAVGWLLPSLVGPALAGWVATQLGWRWVFLAIPVLVLAPLAVLVPRLRSLGAPPVGAAPPRGGRARRSWLALGAAAGVALLQYAGQHRDLTGLAAALTALALLAPCLPPLLPAGTLRARPGLPTTILLRGVLAGAMIGAETFTPLMLVTQRQIDPALAGTALTLAAFGWTLGSWYQGRSRLRLDRARFAQLGAVLVGLGIGGLAVAVVAPWPYPLAAACWGTIGIGMGLAWATVNVLAMNASTPAQQGATSAALQVSDAFGQAAVTAVGGALFSALHTAPGQDAGVFAALFAVSLLMAVVAVAYAPRMSRAR